MKSLKRYVTLKSLLLLGIIGLILLSACRDTDDSWEQIQEAGILRIGVDPTYPPFAVATEGGAEGIDFDLGQALAEEMGLEPQFSYFGYDGLYDALVTRQVDALISALVIAPERTRDIAYSAPYFDAGLYLFFPAGNEQIEDAADLRGASIAVELGSLGHVEALDWQKRVARLDVTPYPTIEEAMSATAAGQADAALVDYVSGLLFIRNHPSGQAALVYSPIPGASEPYAIAVRIEDEILLTELNAALNRLKASGRLDAIIEQYVGP